MRTYKFKRLKRIHGLHFTANGTALLGVGGDEVRMVDSAVLLDLASGDNGARIDLFGNCYAVAPNTGDYVLGGASDWEPEVHAEIQWAAVAEPVQWKRMPWRKPNVSRYNNIRGLAFDAEGEQLAIGHEVQLTRTIRADNFDQRVTVIDPRTGEHRVTFETNSWMAVMSFNATGTRLAATGGVEGDYLVTVYDLEQQEVLFTYEPPGTKTRSAQFLSDDRLVVANGRNLFILPATGGKPQFTLTGHPKQVNAIAITPDRTRVLSASHDGTIRTWNVNTGEPQTAFDWKIGPITAVAFAPDGLTCAAAGLKGQVVVWDVDE
jgi:WD40 repeat protein